MFLNDLLRALIAGHGFLHYRSLASDCFFATWHWISFEVAAQNAREPLFQYKFLISAYKKPSIKTPGSAPRAEPCLIEQLALLIND